MVGPTLGIGWNRLRVDISPTTFAHKLRNNGGFRVVGPMMVQHMLVVWKSDLVNSPCVKLEMFEAVLYGESPKLVTSFVVNTDENYLLRVSAFFAGVE